MQWMINAYVCAIQTFVNGEKSAKCRCRQHKMFGTVSCLMSFERHSKSVQKWLIQICLPFAKNVRLLQIHRLIQYLIFVVILFKLENVFLRFYFRFH